MLSSTLYIQDEEFLEEGVFNDIKSWITSSPKKLISWAENKKKENEKKLESAGLNPTKFNDICEDHAKQAWKEMRGELNWKIASKHLKSCFAECKQSAIDDVADDNQDLLTAIGLSLFTLTIVVIINSFFATFAGLFFVSMGLSLKAATILGMCFTAICIAPITEETGKYFSVKYDYAGTYFVIFNIAEFTQYVKAGVDPMLRLIAVAFHGVLTVIHVISRKEGDRKAEETGKPSESDKTAISGGVIAAILHFFWNLTASLPNILDAMSGKLK